MMAKPPGRSLFDEHEVSQEQASSVLEWLARSYESLEQWKRDAKDIFYSLNGQSEAARNRLAMKLRDYFMNTMPSAEDVRRWNRDHTVIETVRVPPPKLPTARLAYIDWCYLADHILLSCAVEDDSFREENQRRVNESRATAESYDILCAIFEARKIIQADRELKNEQILKVLKNGAAYATEAHVKEARRQERDGEALVQPRLPPASIPLPKYKPLYYLGNEVASDKKTRIERPFTDWLTS
jgi:hypothetical protein